MEGRGEEGKEDSTSPLYAKTANISSIIDGMGEILGGSKSVAISMGVMIGGIPSLISGITSLVRQIRGSGGDGIIKGSTKYSIRGLGV